MKDLHGWSRYDLTHLCGLHVYLYIKNPRLNSSDILRAQLVERQTSIHEVVGSSPTRRSKFSNLNLDNI